MTFPRLALFKNRHLGERVVLVANGPSLNAMDLSFLRHQHTIGLNKIFFGFKDFQFYPRYYVAINALVIAQSVPHITGLNAVKFLSYSAARDHIQEDGLTYYINTTCPEVQFSRDITKGVREGWTVTYAALQLAYYMGFSEVVIIGMDHRFVYNGDPNEKHTMSGPDPNHFCAHYFGYGQEWQNPDFKNAEASYRTAREVFEAEGRTILDATVDGACTIFKKASYKELFAQ